MNRLKQQLCAALEGRLQGHKVRVPDAGTELLTAFMALSRSRSYHASGPNPITWEALAAWSQMMRNPIPPHHAEIIMALDDVWMRDAARRVVQGNPDAQPALIVSSTPLSAGLFDAMVGG
ncbi:phage tail assembly chaperone [Paracoccus sediminilitoris]|uniref:phage tail assembly chaperone n=1 Tax=Paracoccus sediminilitoris TaxID=2202419 RepID=UPI00272C05A7|nr:hypothetical protein [Paracoccus sediminilitoris]